MQHSGDVTRPAPASSGAYALALMAGSVVMALLLQLAPGWTLGLSVTLLATVALAVAAWLRAPQGWRPTPLLSWFLLALLALWMFLMTLLILRNEEISFTAILFPLLVAMLWLKPIPRESASWVADGVALTLIIVLIASLLAEITGLVDSWYGIDGQALAADESSRYWVPLAGLLGLDGRWAGPFVHPNLAGPVGAVLVVYAITRRGWRLPVFALSGVLVLVLASSRTAIVATVAGLLTIVAVWWIRRPSGVPRWLRGVIVALPAFVFVIAIVIVNPGLTGRTTVWPVMVELWRSQPILGIGDAGFMRAIDQGLLLSWADHAHNVFFDALVRTGVIGLALVLCVIALAAAITAMGAGYARGAGIALTVTLIVGSLADTIIHWRFIEVTSSALILAVLMSAADPIRRSHPSSASESAPQPAPAPVPGSDPDPDPAPTA